ncbi:N-6 DNA methylase [Burkholderia pyrrocinia]
MKISSQTSALFDKFVGQLHAAIEQPITADHIHSTTHRLLDGAATEAAQTLLPLNYRQQYGIFFSGHEIAALAATQLGSEWTSGKTIFDPACGAGDLLLAAARQMPLKKNIIETIRSWTQSIGGCDIHNEFVEATRARLLLLAKSRHADRGDSFKAISLESWMFEKIECLDYLKNDASGSDYSRIIANPPFGNTKAPDDCSWSTGQTQLAAVFLDTIIKRSQPEQHIVAILPDVLRSGTRYDRWRNKVCTHSSRINVLPYGRFDDQTDVDVFLLNIKITDKPNDDDTKISWPSFQNGISNNETQSLLRDKYEVRIGSVVPHRLTGRGKWAAYLCVKSAPPFSETTPKNKLRFEGTLFKPPFLVIRRTSNPVDTHRIIPTIVTGEQPVAVENHLIAIFPKSNELSSCLALYRQLVSHRSREWLDNAIRCRHITKRILLNLPIGDI